MTTIYRTQTNRITIAEAKSLILGNLPAERYGAIYAQVTPDGEIDFHGPFDVIEETGVRATSFIDRDFQEVCNVLNIIPVMRIRPAITGFPDTKTMDGEYNISHDEFVRLSERYGLVVEIGEAPPTQVEKQETATPAPAMPQVPIAMKVPATVAAIPKQRAQEARILELLRAQGYDPLTLAQRAPGKPGPKAEIKSLALNEPKLFTSKTFDTAWERLRGANEIAGAE